jgi:signal transduction histidine kinase
MRSGNQSLQVRIALVAGAVTALFCLAVSALVLVAVDDGDIRHERDQIMTAIDQVLYHFKRGVLPGTLVRSGHEEIQVLDPRGRVVAATPRLAGKPPMAIFQPPTTQVRAQQTWCPPAGLNGCMKVVAYRVFRPDGAWLIYVAVPVVPWYADTTLAIFLGVVTLLLVAMAAAGAFHAVGRTLAPVDAIRAQMDEITLTGLGRRVPVPKNQDEIQMLAKSVNTGLDRLEAAYHHMQRFTTYASHELRSPLTAIRTQLDEALMFPDETDWPGTAKAVVVAADRLQTLIIDLLVLAQLDAGTSLACEPTDLSRLVAAELDRRTSRVAVVRRLQKDVCALCDLERITRLLANLMDNAERHATTQITVTTRAADSSAIIEVADDGPGLAPDIRDTVFTPFTRLDTSRNRESGGSGLGLAIAWQIAEAHGGALTIQDSEQGAHFVLQLPRCDRRRPPAVSAQ